MKKARPEYEVVVVERNRADDTFGWGVVFSNETLGHFRAADPESFARITEAFAYWDNIDTHFKGKVIRSGGHGFCGIARRRLLQILQERGRELGVVLRFSTEVEEIGALYLAGDDASLRGLHVSDPRDRARAVPGPRLSLRPDDQHLHRRDRP